MSSQPSLVSYILNRKTTVIGVILLSGSLAPKNALANCLVGDPNKNIVCTSYDFGMPVNITNSTLSPSLTVMDGHVGIGTLSPMARIDTYYALPLGNSGNNFTAAKSQATITSDSDHTGNINGSVGRVTTTGAQSGDITSTIGVAGDISHGGSGTIEYARGINAGINNTSTGEITNAMGINVQAPVNSGAGSIDTFYGIYLATPTAATNNFSIYSQGGKNYFGGDVEIKDTATLKVKTICDNTGSNCKDVTAGWVSGGGGSGSVTSVDTGTGLTGGPITTTGTIAVDVGTTANKIVQLNGSAQLPAVSGANLTNVNAATVSGQTLSVSSPASGQVLSHNGTNWVNKSLGTSDISGLVTALGGKIDASNMPASCAANQTLTFSSPTGMWACSNIVVTPSVFGSQTQNFILAAPTGSSGTPTFRSLTADDLPSGVKSKWIEGSGNIYRATGNVGIGTSTPNSTLEIAKNLTDTETSYAAQKTTLNYSPINSSSTFKDIIGSATVVNTLGSNTYNSARAIGVQGIAALSGSEFLDEYSGAEFIANHEVNNPSPEGIGVSGLVNNYETMGLATGVKAGVNNQGVSIDSANATQASIINNSGSSINIAQGVQSLILNSGSITNATNFSSHLQSINATTVNAIGLDISQVGNITNSYGIKIGSLAGTNKWGIYQNDSTAKNYFNGKIGIGTTTPGSNLDVAGTLRTDEICDRTGANCKTISSGWGSGGGGTGTVTSINTGTGLTGGPITTSGTIAVDVGTTANKIVQLDTNGALPAVDGSNLTNISANKIGGQPANVTTPAFGQFLHYNGAAWHNKTLNISDVNHLMAQLGNKIDASSMPPRCYANQTLTYVSPTGNWSCTYIAITPQVFGTQIEGMVLAAPTSGNGTPAFRKLSLGDLPPGIGDSHWTQVDNYVMHTGSRVGVGVIMAPEAQFDSYYILPPSPTEDEYVANRGQTIIDTTDDYNMGVMGIVGRILVQTNTSGLLNYLTGVVGNVSHKGSSTISTAIGISAGIQNRGSGTIENAYGLFVADPRNMGSGEIHTATGIYINEPTVGTDLNYSIYSTGGDNYFGGNMHVDGTLKVTQICDIDGLNCKNVSDGWSYTSANPKEVIQLRKENVELKKQIELLNQKAKLQENRLSNIEAMLSSKKVANK